MSDEKPKKFPVKFRRHWTAYNGGETAGFEQHIAKALCTGADPIADPVEWELEDGAPSNAAVQDTGRTAAKKAATKKAATKKADDAPPESPPAEPPPEPPTEPPTE